MRYEIFGGNLPVALCKLDAGEEIFCERGAMSWMDDGIRMETYGGGIGKMFGRAFSGETMFRNRYVAETNGEIAFASSFPGEIRAVELYNGRSVIAQKRCLLAFDSGVETRVHFQKRFSTGFFGGEGFIMQQFYGNGTVLLEIDGSAVEYYLAPGERKIVDTGHLVMMDDTCTMTVETVKGLKNKFLGGEGIFNTVITGPGKIILQTMPISRMAERIYVYLPKENNN